MRLAGKVAVVTGAGSRGLGRGICASFAREGGRVLMAGRTLSKLEEASRELKGFGGEIEFVRADVSLPEEASRIVEQAVNRWGRVDILVNNAAVIVRKPFLETTPEEWDQVMAVNARGYFLCAQAAARQMVKQGKGKIVMVSSDAALVGIPLFCAYASSKGAVLSLTRTLAVELAPHQINVNAILPGAVETDLNRDRMADPRFRSEILKRFPLGRLGTVNDIASAALYLAGDDSDWMTGQYLVVDGGHTAR